MTSIDVPAARDRRRWRWMPGLRATAGALLVVGAAVTVFLAHAEAASAPQTHYLVAGQPIPAGTVITDHAHARSLFGQVAVDLPTPVAQGAVLVDHVDALAGRILVAALEPGDLLVSSLLVDDLEVASDHLVAIPLDVADALGGDLVSGHHVDVLATFGSGRDAYTAYVARQVPVVRVGHTEGALSAASLIVTVAVPDASTVLAVGHATRAASLFLSRPGSSTDDAQPPAYRPLPPAPAGNDNGATLDDVAPSQAPPWWPAP